MIVAESVQLHRAVICRSIERITIPFRRPRLTKNMRNPNRIEDVRRMTVVNGYLCFWRTINQSHSAQFTIKKVHIE